MGSADTKSMFEGIETRELSQQGAYFGPGTFKVKIVRTVAKETQNSGDCFIVECEVLETSDAEAHAVGSKRTWIQSMRKKDIGQRAALAFLVAALGYNTKDPKDEATVNADIKPQAGKLLQEACKENNLADTVMALDVIAKTTKEGKPFNLHVWAPPTAA